MEKNNAEKKAVTISISVADKQSLLAIAAAEGLTASGFIHKMIDDYKNFSSEEKSEFGKIKSRRLSKEIKRTAMTVTLSKDDITELDTIKILEDQGPSWLVRTMLKYYLVSNPAKHFSREIKWSRSEFCYTVTIPDLPEIAPIFDSSVQGALNAVDEQIEALMERYKEQGKELPLPKTYFD